MKTIFRVAALGFVIAAFGAAAETTFAQGECTFEMQQSLYKTYREKRKSDNPVDIRVAIKAGEEFLAKCATEDQEAVVNYLKKDIPEQKMRVEKLELFERFNSATKDRKTYNADEAFASGRAIIAKEPDLAFDIEIALALIGFENSIKTPPVDKYNSETINFAKKALSKMQAADKSDNYGAWSFSTLVKTGTAADHDKSKNNTLAMMNYIIGSIMYYNQKAEKDALPYFYKVVQIDSPVKNRPDIYQAIGAWYLSEILKMEAKRQELIKANNNEDNDETLGMLALMKGYADRGINAFGKAHKYATSQQADYKKGLYTKIQGLYQIRFEKTEGLDAYLATASNLPLPDPTTPVTPIVETPPATTSTSTSSSTTNGATTKPLPTVPASTKPATTTPATTAPTKPAATTTTTKPAVNPSGAKVNKPKATVNKKKGTR